jgi:hypothetical protein
MGKHSVGEFSRSGRHRRMGMEHGRLRVDRVGKRGLLFSSIGVSIGEGRAGKLARGSRAGSSSARLGAAREPRTSRAEPLLRARFCSEPSQAGSFQLASQLTSLAKMFNLWNNNEY